jgi:hypothetical protein
MKCRENTEEYCSTIALLCGKVGGMCKRHGGTLKLRCLLTEKKQPWKKTGNSYSLQEVEKQRRYHPRERQLL